MNELASRFALAALVLGLAAGVVTTTGSGGFRGSLGALFGYHTKVKPLAADAAVFAVPDMPTKRLAALRPQPAPARRPGRTRERERRGTDHAAPRSRPSEPNQQVIPAPTPSLPPTSQPPPPKPPAPQGNVERTAQALKEATQPVAPAAPVVGQVVQTISQTCAVIGGCP